MLYKDIYNLQQKQNRMINIIKDFICSVHDYFNLTLNMNIKPILLYNRYITTKLNSQTEQKQIKLFSRWCRQNVDYIKERSEDRLTSIKFCDTIFIDVTYLFSVLDIDQEAKNSIWKHLDAMLDHLGLLADQPQSDSNGIVNLVVDSLKDLDIDTSDLNILTIFSKLLNSDLIEKVAKRFQDDIRDGKLDLVEECANLKPMLQNMKDSMLTDPMLAPMITMLMHTVSSKQQT
jgi:hypothetical protein